MREKRAETSRRPLRTTVQYPTGELRAISGVPAVHLDGSARTEREKPIEQARDEKDPDLWVLTLQFLPGSKGTQ